MYQKPKTRETTSEGISITPAIDNSSQFTIVLSKHVTLYKTITVLASFKLALFTFIIPFISFKKIKKTYFNYRRNHQVQNIIVKLTYSCIKYILKCTDQND